MTRRRCHFGPNGGTSRVILAWTNRNVFAITARSLVWTPWVRSLPFRGMEKNRLEAFSDGVLAIIITIMVLNLKIPAEQNLAALKPLLPSLLDYALSFIY